MSIQRPITKKSYVTCKKPLNALCEKRLQSSMFKWPSFYYFLEFHCKILSSYAIYRCKKVVKILNCYLYAKKVMALCLRVQFFWPTLYMAFWKSETFNYSTTSPHCFRNVFLLIKLTICISTTLALTLANGTIQIFSSYVYTIFKHGFLSH